ncbi:hypothetical protein WJX72_004674 [[Myrmecia] bisecta]|uniref:RNA-binding S4 domain-containing protein n=1 Tax=[Myrmecia] bisecta TaxID=41462 RepID=A0AAW1QEV5_9CHLO
MHRQRGKVNKDPALAPQRLSKVVAAAGIASRRAAEELIFEGRVKLNGTVVTVPQTMVAINLDEVTVDGKRLLTRAPRKYYFALNKPKGYICSNKASDDTVAQSRLVVDLFDDWIKRVWRREHMHPNAIPPRLFTVGRLDVQSTGLILVTNDGAWSQQVSHPSSGIEKEYAATTDQVPTKRQLEAIAAGCIVDGAFVQPVAVGAEASDPSVRNRIRLIVAEGRNREVRVLVSNAGLEVTALKRVRIGGFRLPRDLGIGQFRELKPHEMMRVMDKGAQNNPYI